LAKKQVGVCCLCVLYGKLSFEHIPPRSAFNDSTVLELEFDRLIHNDSLEEGAAEVKCALNRKCFKFWKSILAHFRPELSPICA
jgi:hypothetical protein